jgi:hypothetical protein
MKKLLIILILLGQALYSKSQNFIYIGPKEYPSTSKWDISGLSVTFGKTSAKTGVILVSISEDQFIRQRFGQFLYIFLQNGKHLKLNRFTSDRLDGNILAVYSVGSTYLSQLKNSDIRTIRYTVTSEFGRIDNYTATNEIIEYKQIEMPVPEAEHMSQFDRFSKNIQSRTIGYGRLNDPFSRPDVYYYRNESIRVSKGNINTSSDILNLY